MNFVYTAQRSLIAGHVAATQYAAAFGTTATSRVREARKTSQRALGGQTETLYFGADSRWRISFAPVKGTDLAALLELINSTESGEPFTATVNGDALPAVTVRRTDSGFTLGDAMPVGADPLTTDYFTADIEVDAV